MRPYLAMVFVLAGGVLSACSRTHETLAEAPVPTASKAVAHEEAPILDVPSLLALNIDEVSRRVGPHQPVPPGFVDPVGLPQARLGNPDSAALFRTLGVTMVATYDHKTRQVHDLLLLGHNENELMKRARLRLGADSYLVLPVFEAERPTQLMGVRVLAVLNQ